MTDEELVRTAAELGERETRGLDAERISRRVLARLESEPVVAERPGASWLRRAAYGLAAAAAIVLVVRFSVGGPRVTAPPAALSVLPELDSLGTAELELLLETLPPATDSTAHPEPAALNELDVKSLERLLRSLEG